MQLTTSCTEQDALNSGSSTLQLSPVFVVSRYHLKNRFSKTLTSTPASVTNSYGWSLLIQSSKMTAPSTSTRKYPTLFFGVSVQALENGISLSGFG